jgi:hypothetical protein
MTVCIFSAANEIEAGMVKTALDEKGIKSYLQNSNSLAYLRANLAFGNMDVHVNEEDVGKAIEIIKMLFDKIILNQFLEKEPHLLLFGYYFPYLLLLMEELNFYFLILYTYLNTLLYGMLLLY